MSHFEVLEVKISKQAFEEGDTIQLITVTLMPKDDKPSRRKDLGPSISPWKEDDQCVHAASAVVFDSEEPYGRGPPGWKVPRLQHWWVSSLPLAPPGKPKRRLRTSTRSISVRLYETNKGNFHFANSDFGITCNSELFIHSAIHTPPLLHVSHGLR